ncbi:MAG: polysaccharide deacetylase family protein [Undibacterium sp.]|nr:polysaccharide deacetylase family protein [Opitutaceae bacterium]
MAELAGAGYRTANLGETRPAVGNAARKFVITFDDGYVNVLRYAAPVLARHGFTAIQFIVAGGIGGSNAWDIAEGERATPLMDAAQIGDWLAAGHEIGSHTVSHPRLTQIPAARQREEIFASKRRLEDRFGRPVRHFCYPYGDWNEAVRDLVSEAGYATACTHLESGVNTAATPDHALLRIEARYPRRNLRWLWRGLLNGWA